MDKKTESIETKRKSYKVKAILYKIVAILTMTISFGLIVLGGLYNTEKWSFVFPLIGVVVFILVPVPFIFLSAKYITTYNNLIYRTYLPNMVLNIYDDFALIYNVEENSEYKACLIKHSKTYKRNNMLSFKGRINSNTFTSFCYMIGNDFKGRFISIKTIINDDFTIVNKWTKKFYKIDEQLVKDGDYLYSKNVSEEIKNAHKKLLEKYKRVDIFASNNHYYVYLHNIKLTPVTINRKFDDIEMNKLKEYISIPKYIFDELSKE